LTSTAFIGNAAPGDTYPFAKKSLSLFVFSDLGDKVICKFIYARKNKKLSMMKAVATYPLKTAQLFFNSILGVVTPSVNPSSDFFPLGGFF